jgi:hypothetical protein
MTSTAIRLNKYSDWLHSLLMQFFIPTRISKFMDYETYCFTFYNQLRQNLMSSLWFVSLQLLNSHLNLESTRLGH